MALEFHRRERKGWDVSGMLLKKCYLVRMLFGYFFGYDRIYNHQCKMVLSQELGIPKMGNHENHWGFGV